MSQMWAIHHKFRGRAGLVTSSENQKINNHLGDIRQKILHDITSMNNILPIFTTHKFILRRCLNWNDARAQSRMMSTAAFPSRITIPVYAKKDWVLVDATALLCKKNYSKFELFKYLYGLKPTILLSFQYSLTVFLKILAHERVAQFLSWIRNTCRSNGASTE